MTGQRCRRDAQRIGGCTSKVCTPAEGFNVIVRAGLPAKKSHW